MLNFTVEPAVWTKIGVEYTNELIGNWVTSFAAEDRPGVTQSVLFVAEDVSANEDIARTVVELGIRTDAVPVALESVRDVETGWMCDILSYETDGYFLTILHNFRMYNGEMAVDVDELSKEKPKVVSSRDPKIVSFETAIRFRKNGFFKKK